MINKFKSTAEVAQQLGWDKEDASGFKLGTESINSVHETVFHMLENPKDWVEDVAKAFCTTITPTVAFNVIGNGITDYSTGRVQSPEQIQKSFNILKEEVNELEAAMKNQDKVEILDAVADVIVVAIGIALKEGLLGALPGAFALVSHNNLLKFKFDEETGGFYVDVKDGKIQKPEGFQNVDLSVFKTDGCTDFEEEVTNG